jgi:hypothetical protein
LSDGGRLLHKWVAEVDAKLHAVHPELFDGSREAMLEVVPIGPGSLVVPGSGLGVFVRRNVSIPKGTILRAYGGNIGACLECLGADDYTVEMPLVCHDWRTYRFAVSAAREARRGTDPVQRCKRDCTTTRARTLPCSATSSSAAHCPAWLAAA